MKKTITRVALILLVLVLCMSLTACRQKVGTAYEDKEVGFQTELPAEGETVAIMHTTLGDIYLRLFPEAAPKAVENFLTHASQKYYDGLTFHRVMDQFMVQGGDPKGDGTGGQSVWGTAFEDEFDKKLLNIRGALSMANSGPNTNGSQFFINQMDAENFGKRESYSEENMQTVYQQAYQQYVNYYGESFTAIYGNWESFMEANYQPTYVYDWVPDEVWDLYEKVGGNISLDGAWRESGGHTVFGQVFRGMDVVDKIAAVETDENDKPVKEVIINSIEVTTFKADMVPAE